MALRDRPSIQIDGATVLLTGATGGIGRAIAQRLHDAGASLVLTGRRADVLSSMGQELGARTLLADLADPAQVETLAAACPDVNVLVANAAIPASGDLLDYELEHVQRAIAVDLTAPVMLARLLAPQMVAADGGHVVFIGSLSGKAATPAASLYTAAKFGLRGFALALRQDLRSRRVGVSIVQPGFVSDAGMFAITGEPTPTGVGTVTPSAVADAVVAAMRTGRAEINVAPISLRLRVALAVQLPTVAERLPARRDAGAIVQRIVAAQRSLR